MIPMFYTIGYGNRQPEKFLSILKANDIGTLFDCRAYRKGWHATYTSPYFEKWLDINGIGYAWENGILGNPKMVLPFNLSSAQCSYLNETLLHLKDDNVAFMCSEIDHSLCHRHVIADYIKAKGYLIKHL